MRRQMRSSWIEILPRLIDSLQELQTMAGMLSSMKQELGKKMEQLKGEIPD